MAPKLISSIVRGLRDLRPDEQAYQLVGWFHDIYYDPEDELRRGVQRNYRWLPGDIVDPLDEFLMTFGRQIDRSVMEDAAYELKQESSNWRVRPDELDATQVARSGRSTQLDDIIGEQQRLNPDDLRMILLTRIMQLENEIAALRYPSASFSHNQPPGPLEDLPASKADIEGLANALATLRVEVLSDKPTVATMSASTSKLLSFAKKVAEWTGKRGTKFVDAALESAGKIAGAAFIISVTGLLPQVLEVAATAEKFILSISGH